MEGVSAYAVSKIGSAKLAEYAGNEVEGLRVVNVQPGVVTSEMNTKYGFPAQDSSKFFAALRVRENES